MRGFQEKRGIELLDMQLNVVKTFESIQSAARWLGTGTGRFSDSINRKVKTKPYGTVKHRDTKTIYYFREAKINT